MRISRDFYSEYLSRSIALDVYSKRFASLSWTQSSYILYFVHVLHACKPSDLSLVRVMCSLPVAVGSAH